MKKYLFLLLFVLPFVSNGQTTDISAVLQPTPGAPLLSPNISAFPTTFTTNNGTASNTQPATLVGSNLTAGVNLTIDAGMEFNINGGAFLTSTSLTASSGNITGQPIAILVRIAASTLPGSTSGALHITSSGASAKTITYTYTVNSIAPQLTVTGTLTAFNTTTGTQSPLQTQQLSGINLTTIVQIVPPAPLQVSTDGGTTFSTSANVSNSGTTLPGQPVTITFGIPVSASPQSLSGNIQYTSTGAQPVLVAVTGLVSPISITNDTLVGRIYDSTGGGSVYNPGAPLYYNNWGPDPANNLQSGYFKYRTGVLTPIRAQIDVLNFYFNNNNDCSCTYNSATTAGWPVQFYQFAMTNTSTPNTLTLSGLPSSANGYKLIILSSRTPAINPAAASNTFAIGATSGTVNAKANDTPIVLDNLTPSSGTLTVSISSANGFWYLNTFILIRKN